jgi:transposase InsO family protein
MGSKKERGELEEIIEKIKEQGLSYVEGARQSGLKVRKIYDYTYRKKKKGGDGEQERITTERETEAKAEQEHEKAKEEASPAVPSTLPEGVQEIIIEYRKAHPDHGYKRIEEDLKSRHFIVISRKKIREVLKANGLEKTLDSSFDRKGKDAIGKGMRRFEAAYPRDLYQMDLTYVYITGIPVLYLVVIIDDYSRFCVAAQLVENQRSEIMIEVLHRAIQHYGKPRRLLTDQGRCFYTWSHEHTLFQRYLDDMEIEHIVADPHSPQTCGKVERLHQTLQKEVLHKVRFGSYREAQRGIEDYLYSYNYTRPHQGIGGACPSERFHGIIGETSRIEAALASKTVDFSKGYLIFKNQEHTISIVASSMGLQVFLDGTLLHGGENA